VAKLTQSQRAKLPASAFAYIDSRGRRLLPINDEAHVRNALARFGQVAFEDDAAREKARLRLLKAAKKFGIVPVGFITTQLEAAKARSGTNLAALPTGTVTFLMTDMEASTKLLSDLGDGYAAVLRTVRSIVRRSVAAGGGHEVDARADEFFAAFASAPAAVEAALAVQRGIGDHRWPEGARVQLRIGLHTGRPTLTDTGYIGLSVHTTARVCAAGHGGQTLITETGREAAGSLPGVRFRSLGHFPLAGLPLPQEIFQVTAPGLPARFPKLRTEAAV
jgi:class 3 adenylate cyclase